MLVPPTVGNLLVSCAVSGTHVGSASLRLEPQYMGMGHAAGVAAAMIVKGRASSVHDIPMAELQALLIQQLVHSRSMQTEAGFLCLEDLDGEVLDPARVRIGIDKNLAEMEDLILPKQSHHPMQKVSSSTLVG